MELITKVSPAFASMEKLPSSSVATPRIVPLTTTETPISGSPATSRTTPLAWLTSWGAGAWGGEPLQAPFQHGKG